MNFISCIASQKLSPYRDIHRCCILGYTQGAAIVHCSSLCRSTTSHAHNVELGYASLAIAYTPSVRDFLQIKHDGGVFTYFCIKLRCNYARGLKRERENWGIYIKVQVDLSVNFQVEITSEHISHI